MLKNVARLWALVLTTNLIGAFALAWLLARTPLFDGDVHEAFSSIGF